jgi:hypothetical protein
MLVCSQCKNKEPCTAEDTETKAIFCETADRQQVIRCEWHEYMTGDELYSDPMGQRYHGISQNMQTPIIDPLRPATAAEIMMRKKAQEIPPNRFKLRDQK